MDPECEEYEQRETKREVADSERERERENNLWNTETKGASSPSLLNIPLPSPKYLSTILIYTYSLSHKAMECRGTKEVCEDSGLS